MEHENFEREIPEGYELSKYIDARKALFGLVMNIVAMIMLLIVAFVNVMLLGFTGWKFFAYIENPYRLTYVGVTVGLILMLVYIALHELVHGYAYKRKTGEKLTFGMSWSCAYCGVPNIYVYRKPALFAVLAPLVFFGLIFLLLTAVSLFVIAATKSPAVLNVLYPTYVALTILQGFHIGGCSGDIYVALLLCGRFKDDRALVRDTGPEQFFYVPVKK